jgi:hypothetical protein
VAGSIDRRIEALEKLYGTSAAERSSAVERAREELGRQALFRTLDALAHIKRAPIDRPQWRFDVEKLRDESLFTIACYIVALAHMQHLDEQRAREILEESEAEWEIEDTPLWTLISELERVFDHMQEEVEKQMREEHEKRGA